jgi:putative endonuclease
MYTRNEFDNGKYRRELGMFGESFAAKYLKDVLGWTVCDRNWRCKSGEIDIVALCKHAIVFVEVRTRREGGRFGTAVDSVNVRKLRQIQRVSRIYIHTHGELPESTEIRFDLVAIQVKGGITVRFQHYRNITC